MDDKKQRLEAVIRKILFVKGIELIEIKCNSFGQREDLKILADKTGGGITLDECAQLNREIIRVIDDNKFIEQPYELEVSSPGLDRQLINERDFLRITGKSVRILTRQPVDGKCEFKGKVKTAKDKRVELEVNDNAVVCINLENILKANLELRW